MNFIYGHLRTENIIVTLDSSFKSILKVRFLNLEHISMIENASKMSMPDYIDHLPPEMLSFLV